MRRDLFVAFGSCSFDEPVERTARARLPVSLARPSAVRVFSTRERPPRVGVLVDDRVLDLADVAEDGAIDADPSLFASETLNAFMAAGPGVWAADPRRRPGRDRPRRRALVPLSDARLHLPLAVADYVDFYSSRAPRRRTSAGSSGPTPSR